MKRVLAVLPLLLFCAFAQEPNVAIADAPPSQSWTVLNFYDASNNLIYVCRARSIQASYNYVQFGQFTNVVVNANTGTVTTSVAHGLAVGNNITIAGSATTALNGTYIIQTVPSTTTFTITTSGVANATYTDPTTVSTTAPRSSAGMWSIRKNTYSGTNLTLQQWANGSTGSGVTGAICDNRATLAYQ